MAEKQSFECNTFACKTFACGSFANNQQQIQFITAQKQNEPATFTATTNTVYPTDFNAVYNSMWQSVVNEGTTLLLAGRTMTFGALGLVSHELVSERLMDEPSSDDTVLSDLLTMGMHTSTSVVFGMGISGITSNTKQPEAFSARLMKEPT